MKILLIQLRRIGDVLMTTPSVRALKMSFPDAEIHFLTEKPSDEIYSVSPYVHKIIIHDPNMPFTDKIKFISTLRKNSYDVVMDFFANPTSGLYTFLSGGKRRIGPGRGLRKFYYTDRVSDTKGPYSGASKTSLLEPLGIFTEDYSLDFFISDSDREYAKRYLKKLNYNPEDFVVTISPVSRQPYKVWPGENFSRVCDYLIRRYNAKIIFIYGPGEWDFVKKVTENMKESKPPVVEDIPTISQTKAIFELAKIHIGNDNGPMHFAISAKIPTVAIFGRPKSENWTPVSSINRAVEYDPGCKSNCIFPKCKLECLYKIEPELVIRQIDRLVAQIYPQEK